MAKVKSPVIIVCYLRILSLARKAFCHIFCILYFQGCQPEETHFLTQGEEIPYSGLNFLTPQFGHQNANKTPFSPYTYPMRIAYILLTDIQYSNSSRRNILIQRHLFTILQTLQFKYFLSHCQI